MSETETNTPPEKPSATSLTPDELLSLIQQLLGELSAAGHRSRTVNHGDTLVIQIASAGRSVDAEGRVRLATVAPKPEPKPEPVTITA